MIDDDGAFVHDFDLESELFAAMAEETDGLGAPELDMDKVHGAGRRRRAVLAGSAATVVLVGATAAVVAVGSTTSSGGANPASGATSGPTSAAPPTGSKMQYFSHPDQSGHCDSILTMVVPPPFGTPATPSIPAAQDRIVANRGSCQYIVEITPYRGAPAPLTFTLVPSGGTASNH